MHALVRVPRLAPAPPIRALPRAQGRPTPDHLTFSSPRRSELASGDDPLCRFPDYASEKASSRFAAGTLSPMRDYSLVEGHVSRACS